MWNLYFGKSHLKFVSLTFTQNTKSDLSLSFERRIDTIRSMINSLSLLTKKRVSISFFVAFILVSCVRDWIIYWVFLIILKVHFGLPALLQTEREEVISGCQIGCRQVGQACWVLTQRFRQTKWNTCLHAGMIRGSLLMPPSKSSLNELKQIGQTSTRANSSLVGTGNWNIRCVDRYALIRFVTDEQNRTIFRIRYRNRLIGRTWWMRKNKSRNMFDTVTKPPVNTCTIESNNALSDHSLP